ncbi:MAG: glycosyltransferase family 4 protein [Pseudomonadota bacterium]
MRIFNIMMSRDLGGIQQAYIDYNDALLSQNHEVINIASAKAQINDQLTPAHTLPNLAPWCFLSKIYLGILIQKYKPDIIICHGNRAINFSCGSVKPKNTKIVGVSHNYSYKKLKKCDFIITLSNDLRENLIKHDISQDKFLHLSNMVRIEKPYSPTPYNDPITIGSLGRFVEKKGFSYLIESIKLIRESGHNIRLIIGGDGKEKDKLKQLVSKLNLNKEIDFVGWVSDKDAFFNKIDIFCLPSVSEPFGIIALEAIEHSKPVVATNSGGPQEIIRHEQDGFIANISSAEALAKYLTLMIENPERANNMSKSAYDRIKTNYDIKIVAKRLSQILSNLDKK